MKQLYLIFIAALTITLLSIGVARSEVQEPPINKAVGWEHHASLGVILFYKTSYGGKILFAHPVVDFSMAPECQNFKPHKNLITVLTNAKIPFRYVALRKASAYRFNNAVTWETLLSKTSGDFK